MGIRILDTALRLGALGMLAMAHAGGPARADGVSGVDAGGALAERWCAACHVTAPDAAGGDAGPSFQAVANRPDVTRQGLLNWLAEPHPPMPDLNLTAAEAALLVDYILSLSD